MECWGEQRHRSWLRVVDGWGDGEEEPVRISLGNDSKGLQRNADINRPVSSVEAEGAEIGWQTPGCARRKGARRDGQDARGLRRGAKGGEREIERGDAWGGGECQGSEVTGRLCPLSY